MKKVISVCATAAMVVLFSTKVLAAGLISSPAQKGAELAGEATMTTVSGETITLDGGMIRITNVSDTLSGESGLEDAVNAATNEVYRAAKDAQSTSSFLSLFANGEEIQTALHQQLTSADASEEVDLDDYEAAALFDVSLDDAAAQTMTEGSSVQFPVKVDGITAASNVLALHFIAADGEEVNAMEVEILPCVAGDGFVTLTMTSFSPVMVLTKVQSDSAATQGDNAESAAAGAPESQSPAAEAQAQEEPAESNHNAGIYIGGAVVVVAAAGFLYAATRKKKAATSNKK